MSNQEIPATCAICQDNPAGDHVGTEGLPVCDGCAPSRSWIVTTVATTLAEKAKKKSGRTSYGDGLKGGHIQLGYGFWGCTDFKDRVIVYHDSNYNMTMPVGNLGEILMCWVLELDYRRRVEQFVIGLGFGTETKREDIAF
jgi:hypothetical protein